MSRLADLLHISAPSTTEIINILVDEKKLKRLPDKNDRRIVNLQITAQGKKTLDKSLLSASENIEELLKGLTEKQMNNFDKILEIIINNK